MASGIYGLGHVQRTAPSPAKQSVCTSPTKVFRFPQSRISAIAFQLPGHVIFTSAVPVGMFHFVDLFICIFVLLLSNLQT